MSFKETISPPFLFLKLFRWFCDPDMVEDIEGDLVERFEIRLQKIGQRKARWLFIRDVIQLFRPGIIRSFKGTQKLNNFDMYKNYFKVARRTLLRQKMYSAINIGGFALGIAACLLIALFIKDELSYDQHYKKKDRFYRIAQTISFSGSSDKMVWLPAPYAKALTNDFPEVELVGRVNPGGIFGGGDNQLRSAEKAQNSNEQGFTFADPSILELFEIEMLYGDKKTALAETNSIVISKRKAEKFFPGENPIGKLLILNEDESRPLKVSGVMKERLSKSHFDYDFLVSLVGREFWRGEQTFWGSNNYPTYVRLKENAKREVLEAKLHNIAIKYILPYQQSSGNVNAREFVDKLKYELQPVSDIHLKSADISDPFKHGDIKLVWLFGAIAGLILLIAIINFVNLSTAKSANRAMEIGLRKAIGSRRSDLITQFLTESVLFSLISVITGVILAYLFLPYFNQMSSKELEIPFTAWWLVPGIVAVSLIIGVLAGFYPAFYLSSFKSIRALKGSSGQGSKTTVQRSFLVIFQFTASVVLIVSTLVVSRQMNYILNTEIGFDKEQVVMIKGANVLGDKAGAFKTQLLNLSGVENVTASSYLPVSGTYRNGNLFWRDGHTQSDEGISGQIWRVDHDYVSTLGIKVIEGRDFSRKMATDSSAILINEQMVRDLGLTDPIGQKITNSTNNVGVFTVIGVIEDFHYESLKGKIEGLSIVLGNSPRIMSVKLSTEDIGTTMASIEAVWKEIAPEQIISYDFLDQRFALMYEDVQRTGSIFTSFALFAVIVACLGLFALSVFMVEQRNKEISIRLVLGAPVRHILRILGLGFLKPVAIALLLATPIAWYFTKDWLSDFEYGINLSWDIFALAGLAAIMIAVLTVGYQSLRAALLKPVEGLRDE